MGYQWFVRDYSGNFLRVDRDAFCVAVSWLLTHDLATRWQSQAVAECACEEYGGWDVIHEGDLKSRSAA